MEKVLGAVAAELAAAGINYEYGWYTSDEIQYPYWVGEYAETEGTTEDGVREGQIMLTGTNMGTALDLERDRAKIERAFPRVEGKAVEIEGGYACFWYANALTVPVDVEDLTRLQININFKEWRVL